MRWIVVMRFMRPWGHFGLLFTHGLPWALVAVAANPTLATAGIYLGGYFAMRCVITVDDRHVGTEAALLLAQDAPDPGLGRGGVRHLGGSFARRSIRWRGSDYYIRGGALVPVSSVNEE